MREEGLPVSVPLLRLEMTYDSQGRRIAKRVYARGPSAADPTQRDTAETLKADWRFWYDGWNLMVEKDLISGLSRRYVWGLDLSGSEQGAGGVGGLLGIRVGGKTYTPCTDVNGNILGLMEGSTGTLAARWDYEPFGTTITSLETPGPLGLELCPFRFSSKYRDAETGCYYYGFRYYNPELGRWISRDPIEEEGGINLYGMVGNDPVNRVDLLGLHKGIIAGLDIEIWTMRKKNSILGNLLFKPDKVDLTLREELAIMPCHDDSIHIKVANDPLSVEQMRSKNGPYVMGGADTINGRAYPTVIHGEVYMGPHAFNQPLDVKGLQLWTPFNNAMVEQVATVNTKIEVKTGMWKRGGKAHIVIRAYGGQDKTWEFEIMN
jgi:RHS repeat-associated protein